MSSSTPTIGEGQDLVDNLSMSTKQTENSCVGRLSYFEETTGNAHLLAARADTKVIIYSRQIRGQIKDNSS